MVYLLLTPSYGSMGDQAIAYAEEEYLKAAYPDEKIIVYNEEETLRHIDRIVMENPDNTFYLQGGGNMGSLYWDVEEKRRFVISKLDDCKVVVFPQSLYWESDDWFAESVPFYSRSNITIYARERVSYELMKSRYPCAEIELKPDIVYYLHNIIDNEKNQRTKILLSMRADKETVKKESRQELIKALQERIGAIELFDMYLDKTVPYKERTDFVNKAIIKISEAKIMITDRLHGAILSAITGTPCIFMPNKYHKNKSYYDSWLKNASYIQFLDGNIGVDIT